MRIDECAEWKNKAEAIASYARQSRDEALLHLAQRIKGRAVIRYGELLNEIEAAKQALEREKARTVVRIGEMLSEVPTERGRGGRPKNGMGTNTVSAAARSAAF